MTDWLEFFEAHPEIPVRGRRHTDPERRKLEAERLRWQIRKLKFEAEQAEGLYLLKNEVEAWLSNACASAVSVLSNAFLNTLPPRLVGLGAAEIAAELEKEIPRILDELRTCASKVSK